MLLLLLLSCACVCVCFFLHYWTLICAFVPSVNVFLFLSLSLYYHTIHACACICVSTMYLYMLLFIGIFSIYRWLFDFQKCDVIANASHNTNFPFIPTATRRQRNREKMNYATHLIVFCGAVFSVFFFFGVYCAKFVVCIGAHKWKIQSIQIYIERVHFHTCQTNFPDNRYLPTYFIGLMLMIWISVLKFSNWQYWFVDFKMDGRRFTSVGLCNPLK